ncbi:MAG: type II toxin-antitoxin system RelE/ParE family toxin [Mogibacterium sp.]|nr:type II toxin-antitoxin system RelE/ParE family toxin [Mogibacterium sp.]
MIYELKYEVKAVKQIRKLDPATRNLIKTWIEKNLLNTDNPRQHGKGLTGTLSQYWRYRVGDYRILAEINDTEIVIIIVEVGHRREIYR